MKHQSLDLRKEDEIDSSALKEALKRLDNAMDNYRESLNHISEFLKELGQREELQHVSPELTECEQSFDEALQEYHSAQTEINSGKAH